MKNKTCVESCIYPISKTYFLPSSSGSGRAQVTLRSVMVNE